MVYCPYCGNEIPDGSLFCPVDGAPLNNLTNTYLAPPDYAKIKRKSRVLLAIVLAFFLAFCAGIIFLILRLTHEEPDITLPEMETAEMGGTVPTPLPTISPTPVPTPTPPSVDVTSWELQLIRLERPLEDSFVPESLTEIENGQQVDSRIAQPLRDLLEAARAAGYDVYFCSGYRDYDTQHFIYFNNHVDVYMTQGMSEDEANAEALLEVDYPGTSEHQAGLCADILESPDQEMESYIGGSGLMLWLEQHCAKYGFIVRYPEYKTDVTGREYQPWHLRYVGQSAAEYIMSHSLCLEEFLAIYGAD